MTHEPGDQQLERLFAELREADAQATPAFGPVWQAAAARRARRGAPAAVRAAAAVLLVLAAGAAAVRLLRRSEPVAVATVFSTWRSPTEFLLHGPGDEILRSVPTVSGSVLRLESFRVETVNQ